MKKKLRLTLREWAELDNLQKKLSKAADENDYWEVSNCIFDIIKLVDNRNYRKAFWLDTVKLLAEIQQANLPQKKFPMLLHKEKSEPSPWEYEGRSWYFWLNLFSKAYGWGEEEIAKLDLDTAIGLYQETLIDSQLDQEWQWSLSEVSYSYDKSTKKSKFNKLPRPKWMMGIVEKPKKQKIKVRRDSLPQGLVLTLGGNDEGD